MKAKIQAVFIIMVIVITTLTGCSNNSEGIKSVNKIPSGKNLNFFIATDIHYLSKSLTDNGEAFEKYYSAGDGKQLNYIDEILSAFIKDTKSQKPEVLIISGDLTNNGEKQSHLDLAYKLNELEENGTSVYVIPGNHDILNPWARGFKGDRQYIAESIDDKDFTKIYGDYGYKEAVSRDKNTLSYLAAPSEDVWLLMLDTSQYKNNGNLGVPQVDGQISQETFEWIKKCAAMAKENGARIVTVMHHNILNHSEVIKKGYTLNNSEEALEIFQSLNLDLVLSGHIHIQDIVSYKKDNSTLYDIVTSALSVYPEQYGILKYSSKDKSFDYSTSWVDVEGFAKSLGLEDENLKNFGKYSEEFFGKRAYDKALNQLLMEEAFSDEDIKPMAEVMRILNLRYFAGTENLNAGDIIDSRAFKLITDSELGFRKNYAISVSKDKDTDDNNLHIP